MSFHYEIKILQEEKVFEAVADDAFLKQWIKLADGDAKCTTIQEPPFVLSWYHQYSSHFSPIMVLALNRCDNMVGLLPLARNRETHQLVHAGAGQAEYHGWIAHPEINDTFPVNAILSVGKLFSMEAWQWKWLPPNAPWEWIKSPALEENGIRVNCISQKSPLWEIADQKKEKKIFRNKSIRSKINRYKKRGELFLERITDKNRAISLLKELKNQCDFRQMAVNGVRPFHDDEFKEAFYNAKMNYPAATHFTVLWCGDKPLAFHHGDCDNHTIYIGLTGFDPVESKNSPGTLLLAYIASFARKEGYQFIDLTPGGDAYKDRFKNTEQTLYMPKFYFTRLGKVKDDSILYLKKNLRTILTAGGKTDDIIFPFYKINPLELRSVLKNLEIKRVVDKLIGLFFCRQTYLFYRMKREHISEQEGSSSLVNKQKYTDLLAYRGNQEDRHFRNFLSSAFQRFSNGETLFTIVNQGALAYWGWMTRCGSVPKDVGGKIKQEWKRSNFILCLLSHDKNLSKTELLRTILMDMTIESLRTKADTVILRIEESDIELKRTAEAFGFKICRSYKKTRILFFSYDLIL